MDVMPEDIIAQAVRMFQRTEGAAKVGSIAVTNLSAAGYRILAPDTLDPETLEAAAGEGYRVCAETRHVTLGDKVATAIRSMKGGQQ